MASKVIKNSSVKNIITRNYAAQAAVATKQNNYTLPTHQTQVSKLASGGVVVSLENNSPISKVAIYVRSGARYETTENSGVSQMVRLCAGLGTKDVSAFGITRHLQQLGGVLVAQNGREHMSYGISCLRDNLQECFEMVSNVAVHPSFNPWEVNTLTSRMMTELHARCPTVQALEMLHKAAFRNTSLGNSLFIPDHHIGAITPQQMSDFVKNTHTGRQLAFVGLGVEHQDLVRLATKLKPENTDASTPSAAVYGGGEIRKETGGPLAYVAVAGSGAKLGSEEATSLAVAQFILGTSAPGTKYGSHASSKLSSIISAAGGCGTAMPINATYSDGGLFGFFLIEEAKHASNVLKAITKGIRNLKITDADVKNGKARAKSAILMAAESTECQEEEMGMQTLLTGNYSSSECLAAIDKVTTASVQSALTNATKGKASMGAVGNLHNVPYLDQL